jgi:hypothetical protein
MAQTFYTLNNAASGTIYAMSTDWTLNGVAQAGSQIFVSMVEYTDPDGRPFWLPTMLPTAYIAAGAYVPSWGTAGALTLARQAELNRLVDEAVKMAYGTEGRAVTLFVKGTIRSVP